MITQIHPVHGGNIHLAAHRLGKSPDDLLDYSASINPLGPPEGLMEHMRNGLKRLVHYPEPFCASLKEKIAAAHGVKPSTVVVGNGSTQLIYLLIRSLAPARILIVCPAFGEYERAAEACGCHAEFDYLDPDSKFTPKRNQIKSWITSGVSMIFLGSPTSPAGNVFPPEVLAEIISEASRKGIIPVIDEAFVDFCPGQSILDHSPPAPNVIVLRSFTKMYALPGLRLGYLVASADLAERIESVLEPWSVNYLAHAAGLFCLQADSFKDTSVKYIETERKKFLAALNNLNIFTVFPSDANYLLARIDKADINAELIQEYLLEDGILIRNCSSFRGLDNKYIRLAVRSAGENAKLIKSLEKSLLHENL